MLASPSVFFEKCTEWGVTFISLPTAYWHQLAASFSQDVRAMPSLLRLITVGGEKMLAEAARIWRRRLPPRVQLMNTYGPTEATVVATAYELTPAKTTGLRDIPIGRALPHVQTRILDRNLQLTPVGIAGELHLGGVALARGYLNQPELTAEKFIRSPFEDGAYFYKTGDIARYLPDGNIEFLGRADHQVKIRGFRIELGEIEATLCQHPNVREAVVIATEDKPVDKQLIAYLVATSSVQSDTETEPQTPELARELRGFIKSKLPEYMIPSAFVVLDKMPVNANGKLDRKALPVPDHSRTELEETYVAPRTPIEQSLATIWTDVLKGTSINSFPVVANRE